MEEIDLKVARIRAGLTLWDVGQLVGLHEVRISEMERGRRPISEAVAKGLGLELTETPKVEA